MENCIICGTSTDGPICDIHQEDVVFEFKGNTPAQLTPGRFYRGTVDGYAEFGVFVNVGAVTGLLHRSKLDRRLESLDWEVGDTVYVQVENIRDNGDIDLAWSIRQSDSEFRGVLVDAPDGDRLMDDAEAEAEAEQASGARTEPPGESTREPEPESAGPSTDVESESVSEPDRELEEPSATAARPETESESESASASVSEPAESTLEAAEGDERLEEAADVERVPVEDLSDRVSDTVRLEGEIESVRQTSGPTVFELRDETGVVDAAAFVEPGVRAFPDVEADDVVGIVGEVRRRRDEIQVESETIAVLDDEDRQAVLDRMERMLDERARPETVELLAEDGVVEAVVDEVADVATEIRRAILESRPVVIRHDATTDGYVAGAAIERAVLPLIEDHHATADAVYHYFDRRPLEDGVYDMNDATRDVTRMLGDRDRHEEKLPLFIFAAAGSTSASLDGLELLDVYEAPRIVIDGRTGDDAIDAAVDYALTVSGRTATTIAATVAAAVNDDARDDLVQLPAISYWGSTPAPYAELVADDDAETIREIREAIALEAYYQSYEDKRELVDDLLFERRIGLASQVSEQFRQKLDAEVETALANLEERDVDGVIVSVLDTDAFTHRFDFPSTRLLLDELDRRLETDAVIGVGSDELEIRSSAGLDISALVESLQADVPTAGVTDPGARQEKLEFLVGERDAVIEAVVEAVARQVAQAPA